MSIYQLHSNVIHSYDRNVKSSNCYLKIGHVVIVKDETLPRLSWRKGRIIELHAGNDDVIKNGSLKVYQKNSDKTFILKRPLHHLVLLDTTIKEPAIESQYSAINADVMRKLTTCLCHDPNPGGNVSIIQNIYIYAYLLFRYLLCGVFLNVDLAFKKLFC